jgi:sulfate/thiosulfate transport system substrate-binding protein
MKFRLFSLVLTFIFSILVTSCSSNEASNKVMLNVSYDPTREMYQEYNEVFKEYWKEKTGQTVEIRQSHGGAGKQARSVIDGLDADIVTLALAYDIDQIAQRTGKFPIEWQSRLPNNSCPYTSAIVFLVRKGNPKNVKDWDDLIRDNISVITPNPKTSGGARWNYLAAWAFADKLYNGDLDKIKYFMKKLFKNVPVLDSGARGSTNTFIQRGIGDVLLAWENEAILAVKKLGKGEFDIVVPSVSIKAEPPVTVIDSNAVRKGNLEIAQEYLKYLYSEKAQEILAKHFYRPSNTTILNNYADQYPDLKLIEINSAFGGWEKAQTTHFKDGGIFDQIFISK